MSRSGVSSRCGGRRYGDTGAKMQILGDRLKLSDRQFFWLLQVSGWFGLAVLALLSLTLVFNQTDWPYLVHPFVQSLIGILVSWPMRGIFHAVWNSGIAVRLAVVTVTVLSLSLLWTFLRLTTFIRMTGEEKDFFQEMMVWYFSGVLVFIGWAALYHGFRYYRLLQEEHDSLIRIEREKQAERLKRENAERLAQETQLKMLRYQLNPHFLFNTLNAITSLVNSGQNAEASRMVDSLSTFLRDSLQGDPLKRVTLREELRSLENYLDIEQVRFGDRLVTDIRSADADPDFPVPGLILQPLAENVIKHAVRSTTQTVNLTVTARGGGDRLGIEVCDTGPGIPGLEGDELPQGGIGLRNVRDRLRNTYGDDASFRLGTAEEGGLRVSIRIPAERATIGEPAADPEVSDG